LFLWQKSAIANCSFKGVCEPEDVGKPRAEVTAPRVAELNSYVPVTVHEGESLVGEGKTAKKDPR
jgi:ubiquitin-activating enzyme E1